MKLNKQFSSPLQVGGLQVSATRELPAPARLLFMPTKITGNERVAAKKIEAGEFMVDANGRVWRIMKRKWAKAASLSITPRLIDEKRNNGYRRVDFRHDGALYSVMAHRIVWQHFNGPIPGGLQINHKNGIRDDNRPSNLEAVTQSQNMRHAFRVLRSKSCAGQHHSQHKLTDLKVIKMRREWKSGEDLAALSNRYGVTVGMVSRIVRGLNWSHITMQPTRKPLPKQTEGQLFLI